MYRDDISMVAATFRLRDIRRLKSAASGLGTQSQDKVKGAE
jgi:hypothetical protein